jgi:hypothetical protein
MGCSIQNPGDNTLKIASSVWKPWPILKVENRVVFVGVPSVFLDQPKSRIGDQTHPIKITLYLIYIYIIYPQLSSYWLLVWSPRRSHPMISHVYVHSTEALTKHQPTVAGQSPSRSKLTKPSLGLTFLWTSQHLSSRRDHRLTCICLYSKY